MKQIALTTTLVLLFGCNLFSQPIPEDSLYFGQTPPGNIPQVFAPGLISLPDRNEPCITFAPDGKTVFFYIEFYPNPGTPYIMYSEYKNDSWTAPDTIPFTAGRATGEPFLAFNGNRLYMWATDAENQHGVADLSYSEKQGENWGEPISLGNPPNTETYQYHPCIVGDTSVYFSSNAGYICKSQYTNGVYQNKVILPKPINYVGTQTWGDPYVAPDESYMIFKSIRSEGYGQHDLYISYKKEDQSWTNPKNLGDKINTPHDETAGDITPDGEFMTYGSNKDLYWVSTSFIDSLYHTNFVPYVKNAIQNQTASINQLFNYTVPDSIFMDDDGIHTLLFEAKLSNGNSLPSWLSFNTSTLEFEGTPSIAESLSIKVTATDTAGASAYTIFAIEIIDPSAIDLLNEQGINIFPNPSNGLLNISLGSYSCKTAIAEICSIEGRVIYRDTINNNAIIDMSSKPKGVYIIKLFIGSETIIKKVSME